jgi:hypothetical protein
MMIRLDAKVLATIDRISDFQRQIVLLRQVIADPEDYRLSAGGFIAEVEKMQNEVNAYLRRHPAELVAS